MAHYDSSDEEYERRDRSPLPTGYSYEMASMERTKSVQDRTRSTTTTTTKTGKVPMKVNRSCTDVAFLIVFLFVLLVWILLGFVVIRNVDIRKLYTPADSDGNLCGYGDMRNKSYLYVLNFTTCAKLPKTHSLFLNCGPSVCVAECPSKFGERQLCTADATRDLEDQESGDPLKLLHYYNNGSCVFYQIPTSPIVSFCIPQPFDEDFVGFKVDESDVEQMRNHLATTGRKFFLDLRNAYPYILGCIGVSLVLAFMWIQLMRLCAAPVVWIFLLSSLALSGGTAAYAGYTASQLKQDTAASLELDELRSISYMTSRWEAWAALAVSAGIVFIVLFLVLIYLRKRIQIAIALIKQACRSMTALPTLTIFPIFPFALQVSILGAMAMIFWAVISAKSLDEVTLHERCLVDFGGINSWTRANTSHFVCDAVVALVRHNWATFVINAFSGIWAILFVSAFSYMVVAHAVANYFWTHKEEGTPFFAVASSVAVAAGYHLGTLAFGSLILTFCVLIKHIMEYIRRKIARITGNSSCLWRLVASCCCCIGLLETIIMFLNKRAYIMVAMYGKNFCKSASRAFKLMVASILRTAVVTKVTDLVVTFSKIVTVVAVSGLTYFIFTNHWARNFLQVPTVSYTFIPVGVVAVGSIFVTSSFFAVYTNALETLYLCFLEDTRLNDGSLERPYHMPTEMLRILNKKNYRKRAK